ncbi:MAG: uroporphyrinogen-III synthase [Actinomycetota bacterium]
MPRRPPIAGGGPLEGMVVLVTRPREQAAELVEMLAARGAVPLLAPAIRLEAAPVRPLDRAVRSLLGDEFEWVVFTSRMGVEALLERLRARGARASEIRARVAAVGDGTAGALRDAGREPDLVPATYTTEALATAMPRGSGRILLVRADIAPEGLESTIAAKGWAPVRVDAYRTRLSSRLPVAAARALEQGRVDAITLASASTVDGLMRMAGPILGSPGSRRAAAGSARGRPKVVCIGPVTARAARLAGLHVDAVARPHTIEGLVRALERVVGKGSR